MFTAHAIRGAFERTLASAGGSLGTWIVLSALSENGLVSQSAIAGHARVEGATITHHIDRLESLGLVRRSVDPEDRRVRRVELTPEGVELHRRLLEEAKRLEAVLLAGLDERERADLLAMLDRIRTNVDAARGG